MHRSTPVFDSVNIRRAMHSAEANMPHIVIKLIAGSSIQSRRGSFASCKFPRSQAFDWII
jgi:hypothetical protein